VRVAPIILTPRRKEKGSILRAPKRAEDDPDTQVRDKDITRDIYRRFDAKLALNCFVIEGGELTVGDEVQLVRGRACAVSAAATVFEE